MKTRPVTLNVNGRRTVHELAPETLLLYVLRNDLGLTSPKFGCGLGECGACAVLVDGRAVRACTTTIAAVEGRTVTTLEGLGTQEAPHPVQQAFIAKQAAQCGYCLNGMIMATTALLAENPAASESEIRTALSRHLCRCGTHVEILAAARLARDLVSAPASNEGGQ